MDLRLTNATQSLPISHTEGSPPTGKVFAPCTTLPEFRTVSLSALPTPCTALGELPPPTNTFCYITRILLAAESKRLRTRNSVVVWKPRLEIILQRDAAMSTHWP